MGKTVPQQETPRAVLDEQDTEHKKALEALRESEEALRKAHDELEQRVEERTAALSRANEKLKAEIAAREQAEQALRRYAWVFEHTRSGVVTASGKTFELVNPAFARMHGYTVDELIGAPITQVFLPEDADRVPEIIRAATEKGDVTYEVPHRCKDGTVFPALIQVTAVKDAQGDVVQRIATVLDVTERKQAEEALREREESFRLMFVNNPVPMWVFDEETLAFLAVNDAAVRHYGYSRDEFLAMTIKEIRPPEEVSGLIDYLSTQRDERRRVWDWKHRKKDGTDIYVEIASHGLRFAGRQARLVLANVITERKEAEEKLRRYARRLETLQELDRAILAARSPHEIAAVALAHLEQLVPYWHGSITLVDYEADTLMVLAHRAQVQTRFGAGVRLAMEAVPLPDELARGDVFVMEEALAFPSPPQALQALIDEGLRSGITVPLRTRGHLIGGLNLGLDRPGAFRPEHVDVAREVADSVAIAIQQARLREQVERHAAGLEQRVTERTEELSTINAALTSEITERKRAEEALQRAHDELERRVAERTTALSTANRHLKQEIAERQQAEASLQRHTRRLETLKALDRAILAAQSPEEVADGAMRHIQALIPCLRASVVIFDFDNEVGVVIATRTQGRTTLGAGTRFPLRDFAIPEPLYQGDVVKVDDIDAVDQDQRIFGRLRAEGLRAYVIVPLVAGGDLIGMLNLGADRPGAFSDEHVAITREVADPLAIAIQHAQLHAQIEKHAAELEQRVKERTAELEAFSYSVSHDLRTPLRAVDGFSRVLVEDYADALDEECRRVIRIIRSNAQNMGRLIDGLLAFSGIGRREMQPCHVNVRQLVEEVYVELLTTLEARTVRVEVQPLPSASGDRSMLRQVFINLLSNAIKFTRSRPEAMIEVGAETAERVHTYWVKDNGVGFEQAYADKLFGVFQRLHTAEAYEGTGVGLAIVQRIVARHGGRVWAEGRVGQGATLYFTLPRGGGTQC